MKRDHDAARDGDLVAEGGSKSRSVSGAKGGVVKRLVAAALSDAHPRDRSIGAHVDFDLHDAFLAKSDGARRVSGSGRMRDGDAAVGARACAAGSGCRSACFLVLGIPRVTEFTCQIAGFNAAVRWRGVGADARAAGGSDPVGRLRQPNTTIEVENGQKRRSGLRRIGNRVRGRRARSRNAMAGRRPGIRGDRRGRSLPRGEDDDNVRCDDRFVTKPEAEKPQEQRAVDHERRREGDRGGMRSAEGCSPVLRHARSLCGSDGSEPVVESEDDIDARLVDA